MMRRVTLCRLTVALLMLVLGASSAFARPTVAILGLEVKGAGSIDQQSTSIAHDLTEGMRARARKPKGPYQLAPKTEKELIDEKLIKDCDDEALNCMAQIGQELVVDFLVYGKVEKESGQYTVTLHVLNVNKKTRDNTIALPVPLTITSDKVRALARKAYNDLVGGDEGGFGTLIVTSNALRGKVYLDDEFVGKLTNGELELPTVSEGRWRLAIEAPGYSRKENVVVIRVGDTTNETLELTEHSSTNFVKPVFWASASTGAALGLFSLYAWSRLRTLAHEAEPVLKLQKPDGTPCTDADHCQAGPEDCNNDRGLVMNYATDADAHQRLDDLCTWQKIHKYTAWTAGVIGVGALVAGYFAFFRNGEHRSAIASRRRNSLQYSFTPVITPDVAAASFQLEW